MATQRQKFTAQASPLVLKQLKAIAQREGRQFQSVIEEAFLDYIDKKSGNQPRPQVLAHFSDSLKAFDPLYERLAQ